MQSVQQCAACYVASLGVAFSNRMLNCISLDGSCSVCLEMVCAAAAAVDAALLMNMQLRLLCSK
jgi:hypothetical protein